MKTIQMPTANYNPSAPGSGHRAGFGDDEPEAGGPASGKELLLGRSFEPNHLIFLLLLVPLPGGRRGASTAARDRGGVALALSHAPIEASRSMEPTRSSGCLRAARNVTIGREEGSENQRTIKHFAMSMQCQCGGMEMRSKRQQRMRAARRLLSAGCLAALLVACGGSEPQTPQDAQAIVVGSGISGLSAAVEMGRAGVRVLVVDMNSVAGGHAVMAGGVTMVGTPVQEKAGIEDSPDLAYNDWMEWTEDGDPQRTRYYAENSRKMIYDWVTDMGVDFVRVAPAYANSVPRFHFTKGRAVYLVLPIYRTALGLANVSFLWNAHAEHVVLEDGRVTGVVVRDLRSGESRTLHAPRVVLATGGFESDLKRVLANWTPGLPQPDRLLIGSSVSATGSGHDMAVEAGAALENVDRHYIYVNGLLDPRDPNHERALTAGNDDSMWVNAQGRRFTNETGPDKQILVDLLNQDPSSYWAIFDAKTRDEFGVRGAVWLKTSVDGDPILDNPQTAKKAESLEELAALTGLPSDALQASIERFNAMIDNGEDTDFGRFGPSDTPPPKIEQPPFYAVQMFPMTRKTMGGVAVDMQSRALAADGSVVPGLYAVGELNGSMGINGKHGMDGTFLGPAILTGRLAGQSIAADVAAETSPPPLVPAPPEEPAPSAENWQPTLDADALRALLAQPRDGYWHFQQAHRIVLERGYECTLCHSAEVPFAFVTNRQSRLAQTEVCTNCH
jgi:predicted oxidoreductase